MDEDLQSSDDVVNDGVERCLKYLKGAIRKRREGKSRSVSRVSVIREDNAERQMEEREEGKSLEVGEETRSEEEK